MFVKILAYLQNNDIIIVIFGVVFVNKDLINIKDKYGEKMMHFCRKNFSTILETDGLLYDLLSKHFNYSRFLYDDIVNNSMKNMFKNYIYSLTVVDEEKLPVVPESASELLSIAGYDLYQCFCEEDIQSYRKYYSSEEELCSFRGNRLDDCFVFFAIKKDVDQIRRKDFVNPMRQDRYGTSVISIQFTRGKVNTLSIKNRYNHKVSNPDATFSNNLENIIPGLTRSFERDYNLNINYNIYGSFEMPGYVLANDGKYYKYNYEINNIYYCVDNIIIDNFDVVRDYQEKEKYLIVDYFIIDLVNKKISLYDKKIKDSFIDGLDNIKKIDIVRDKSTGSKILDITFIDRNKAYIEIDKYNRIISYKNDNIMNVGNNFLSNNIYLENIDMPNVVSIGDCFLIYNKGVKKICFNKVLSIGGGFLTNNEIIDNIELENVMLIGEHFLCENIGLSKIEMLKLEKVGDEFLEKNRNIYCVNMPNLIYVSDGFLRYNICLKEISLPKLEHVGSNFIAANKIMESIYLPRVIEVEDNFLFSNLIMKTISLESLRTIGHNFMYCNRELENVFLPMLAIVGMKFLYKNNNIERLELLELVKTERYFMYENNSLKVLLVPKLERVDVGFLVENNVLDYVEVDIEQLDGYVRCFDSIYVQIKKRILKS